MFDAYVVYQTQSEDKVAEVALTQFIAQILPSVLEEKCGYRLFIHGRDDTPGEGPYLMSCYKCPTDSSRCFSYFSYCFFPFLSPAISFPTSTRLLTSSHCISF